MNKSMALILAATILAWLPPADARDTRTRDAAIIGGGVGLIAGGGSGAAKGALVGAGAGSLTNKNKGDRTDKYAARGAAAGAGVGCSPVAFQALRKAPCTVAARVL